MDLARAGRMIWPEDGTRFAAIGGFVGLASDFASFLGNLGSPRWLLGPALLAVGLLFAACWRRVFDRNLPPSQEAVRAAVDCLPCTAFRVLLFACIGIGLLVAAGQGATATERIGTQLGLIQRDVQAVRGDTTRIREDVGVVRDALSAHELVPEPATAAQWFHNAWVYANVRNDPARAWDALQALYRDHVPNRLDAADLYRTIAVLQLGSGPAQARVLEVARARRDAAMLVIAGRHAATLEQAFALYAEARAIDPGQPFAYWDLGRTDLLSYGTTQARTLAGNTPYLQEEIAGLERFLEVAARAPVSRYFYQPRFQPDYEAMARQFVGLRRTQLAAQGEADRSLRESHRRLEALRRSNEAARQRMERQ